MNKIINFWNRGWTDLLDYVKCFPYKTKALLLIILGILLYIPYANIYNSNHDEQSSMLLMGYPWKEMYKLIAIEDGHPPLYHTIYRLFQWNGDFHNILGMRIATLCIFALSALLGVFPLRRLLGEKASLIYIILMFTLPPAMYLAINIRMYPLAQYLMTGAFLYSLLIIDYNKKSDWLFFVLFSIAGLYTHYLCGVLLLCMWGIVFFRFLQEKKYSNILFLFILGIFVAITYIPWIIFAFIKQYGYMKDLWFPNRYLCLNSFWGAFFGFRKLSNPFVYFIIIAMGFLCWYIIWNFLSDTQEKNKKVVKYSVIVFWGMFIIAFIISIFIRPLIFERLMIVPMGILYIALTAIFSSTKKYNKMFISLLIPVFVFSYSCYYDIANDSNLKQFVSNFKKETKPEKSLIIYNLTIPHLLADFYFPEYSSIPALSRREIILFQDKVVASLKYEKELDKFEHIYYFTTQNNDWLSLYFRTNAIYTLNSTYIEYISVYEISKDDAKKILEKSKIILINSLRKDVSKYVKLKT